MKNSGLKDFSEVVLVLGGGPIGLAVNVVLRIKGAKKAYFSEPTEKKRKFNKEVAEEVFDPKGEKVGEKCRELTDGEGMDFVFDCAGVEKAIKDGFDALKFGGIYLNVASWVTPASRPSLCMF